MKVLSLFSGVGGFDLGLENAGMETVFQCEWDKHATSILQRHWPDVPRWGDITTLTGRHILDHAPVIDVVAWGSPCQDLSVAGKRAGLGGTRSGLFHEGIRIINELRELTNGQYPRISIWENVYGALSSNGGADFGQVLNEMDEAGACFSEWRVLDAQYFGVPQRRRRVFVVSIFDPATAERCSNPLLPVSEGVRWDTETSGTARETATGTTQESFGNSGFQRWSETDTAVTLPTRDYKGSMTMVVEQNRLLGSDIVGSLNAVDYKWPQNQQLDENKFVVQPFVKAKRAQSATDDETWVEGDINPTINQFDQGDVRDTTAIVMRQREGKPGGGKGPLLSENKSLTLAAAGNDQTLFVEQPTEPTGFQPGTMTRLGGGVWEGVVPTPRAEAKRGDNEPHILAPSLTASNDPSRSPQSAEITQQVTAIHEATMSVRRLTPLECERLMGWPDDWTAGQADTHRYKQCGNGVASPVATWIAQQLMAIPEGDA